jgi:hypothetical protein
MQHRHQYKPVVLGLILFWGLNPAVGQQQVVWPNPPATARIILERVISDPSAFTAGKGFRERLLDLFQLTDKPRIIRPMGIASRDGYLAVADPGAGGVHLFNINGEKYIFIKPHSDPDHRSPMDVTFGEQELYVLYPQACLIEVYHLRGKYKRTIDLDQTARRPTSLTYYEPYLFITDTPRHQIICMDIWGKIIRRFGQRGTEPGELNFPTFIATAGDGTVYISDTMNFRVQRFSWQGIWDQSYGCQGIMSGQFNRPKGVALDSRQNLYVVDNSFDNVQIFNPDGQFLMHFGQTGHRPGQMMMPTDIAIDGDLIYVSDTMNNRIQVFRKLYE